jgi:deferrochelatase/peroxidase EfeB
LGYKLDCASGELEGFSCKLLVADRTFYIKYFQSRTKPTQYVSCNQDGKMEKDISQTEFDLWLNILADSEEEIKEIQSQLENAKKY